MNIRIQPARLFSAHNFGLQSFSKCAIWPAKVAPQIVEGIGWLVGTIGWLREERKGGKGLPHVRSHLTCGVALNAAFTLLTGCAFDISHIKQQPVNFTAKAVSPSGFVLFREAKIPVGSGFPTQLKANTRWTSVGTTPHGDVFATKDQIVTVEASNMYEAQLVIANSTVTGFYLPVERTFVAATRRVPLETKPLEGN